MMFACKAALVRIPLHPVSCNAWLVRHARADAAGSGGALFRCRLGLACSSSSAASKPPPDVTAAAAAAAVDVSAAAASGAAYVTVTSGASGLLGNRHGEETSVATRNGAAAATAADLAVDAAEASGTRAPGTGATAAAVSATAAETASTVAALTAAAAPAISAPRAHVAVLEREVVEGFRDCTVRTFVDGTLGAAGHSCAIVCEHPELERLVGIDMDLRAHAIARPLLDSLQTERPSLRVVQVHDNFSRIDSVARDIGLMAGTVDGVLLDLGVSSMQIDDAERGFSFVRDGPLDMRMNIDNPGGLSAETIVNEWPEDAIGAILRDFGEERHWRAVARRIVDARRRNGRITTTAQLAAIIASGQPNRASTSPQRRAVAKMGLKIGLHPATRSFQGLRIAVNGELSSVENAIPRAASLLSPGGRLAIISFHSLEDRIVKHSFLEAAVLNRGESMDMVGNSSPSIAAFEFVEGGGQKLKSRKRVGRWTGVVGTFKVVTRKPLVANEDEVKANPRSRSAKLRILEREQ